ncbi:peptidase [Methanobacterium petrolearium]|uniref:peptidase n=1 Tax=Methanobacterium petrolearium TaxID=710190 RepID=UPI001AE85EF1|nr:peptidase [Methanobacterium petrolearium]MBP1945249.1 hypothetical protein [Methanobacterium petrolearium]BDZ71189.1 hypothetical protein GCM10025861_17060 [Methanobacterium petrolearium]
MDLKDLIDNLIANFINFWNAGWENKALVVVGVVVLIILLYAFNPFQAKTNLTGENNSQVPQTTTVPTTEPITDSVNSSNSTNDTGNDTYLITAEQAKQIALRDNIGYTAGDPLQGTVVVNQTTAVVWIVPLSKHSQFVKNVYVDVNTGIVIEA